MLTMQERNELLGPTAKIVRLPKFDTENDTDIKTDFRSTKKEPAATPDKHQDSLR